MIYLIVGFLGLVMGSFINATVERLHAGRDFVRERSACDSCGHQLSWLDLLPVVSWLGLRGRCRYCRQPISARHPLVELGMAGLFVVSAYQWDFSQQWAWYGLAIWLAIVVCMVAVSLYDWQWFEVPMTVVYVMLGLGGLLFALQSLQQGLEPLQAAQQLLVQLFSATALIVLPWALSRGRWMGEGDIYLAALSGLVMGSALAAFGGVLSGFYLGSLVVLPLLLVGKLAKGSKIPFGPFILSGIFIWYLWQPALVKLVNEFILI